MHFNPIKREVENLSWWSVAPFVTSSRRTPFSASPPKLFTITTTLPNGLPAMSGITRESAIWLSVLGLGYGIVVVVVPTLLQKVKDAARSPLPEQQPPKQKQRLQEDSENALKIDTLRTLADGHSYDLRTSALKIAASRTVRSFTKELLLKDLVGDDGERRGKAIEALMLVVGHDGIKEAIKARVFDDRRVMKAVVRALMLVRREVDVGKGPASNHSVPVVRGRQQLLPSPIRPLHRPAQEHALMALFMMLLAGCVNNRARWKPNMDAALSTGLVTKWLANYPFPCTLPEYANYNWKKEDVVVLIHKHNWGEDDIMMFDLVAQVMNHPLGVKQLRDVGLLGSDWKQVLQVYNPEPQKMSNNASRRRDSDWWIDWGENNSSTSESEDNDVEMINGEDTAGIPPSPQPATRSTILGTPRWPEITSRRTTRAGARLRSAERSHEEENLRRRHREAIVVAERGAPLRRENIIQREGTGSPVLQTMGGVGEVEGELNGFLGTIEVGVWPGEVEDEETRESIMFVDVDPIPVLDEHSEREADHALTAQEVEIMAEDLAQGMPGEIEFEQVNGSRNGADDARQGNGNASTSREDAESDNG
jgi:hypothetical protein